MNACDSLTRVTFFHRGWVRLLLVTSLLFVVGAAPRPAVAQGTSLFPPASNVLAQFEFNNSAEDSSGNDRDGELLGGTFVATPCGGGLRIAENTHGLDWSEFANQLVHPYTIEMILTPEQTNSYAKLFSHDAAQDSGWYYHTQAIRLFPLDRFGQDSVLGGQLHYIAFVSTAADRVDIYFQGALLGNGEASFTAPPTDAIFFQDDTATALNESLRGVVEALRISSVARSASEISTVQGRILGCNGQVPDLPLFLPSVIR